MFFFFIAGIQPKTVIVDNTPRICPNCGFNRAILKRTDHYFTLFFIPLFRVQTGKTFLECTYCSSLNREYKDQPFIIKHIEQCPKCGKKVSREYKYCPYCGKKLV